MKEENRAELKNCKYVGMVSTWGKSEKDMPELKILLRNQAGDYDEANVVLSSLQLLEPDYLIYGKTSFKQLLGTTYTCSEKDLETLRSKFSAESN
jgi:hypothetical protein